MSFNSLEILFPLFLLIAGGFVLCRRFSLSEVPFVRVVTDFLMPLLVFHSFCTTEISPESILRISGVVTLIVALAFIACWIYCRSFALDFKAVAPPILFMNSGFLGIPIMKLWGGVSAMNIIVIYDQVQTFYIFTLGIIIVTGSYSLTGLKEMVRAPLIWAILLGLCCNLLGIIIPEFILNAIKFGGDAAPPLATFVIGMILSRFKIALNAHVFAGVAMRLGLAIVFGIVAAMAFDLSGEAATVVVVASALPSAVFSVVLPVRYGVDAKYASSVLIVSTVLSFLTLPFVFQLGNSLFR